MIRARSEVDRDEGTAPTALRGETVAVPTTVHRVNGLRKNAGSCSGYV